jgi:hypothetical protein
VSGVEASRAPFEWSNDGSLYVLCITSAGGDYFFAPLRLLDARHGQRMYYTEPASILNIGPRRLQINNRADWLYCWPNPTSGASHFRISVGYAAEAEIRVFDLAGRLVADLHGTSAIPEPFEVVWDVGNVESGVYLGRVKVSGAGQSMESQVKIAVVK